jgi:hypothetical protein
VGIGCGRQALVPEEKMDSGLEMRVGIFSFILLNLGEKNDK